MLRLIPTLILAALLASSAGAQLLPIILDGGGGGGAAPDWGSTFVATWEFDNTAEATSGSCTSGTDCDLNINGEAAFDASGPWSGTHAATFDGVSDWFACLNATCDEITGLTGSVTAMCAARPEAGITGTPTIFGSGSSATGGWLLDVTTWGPAPARARVGDGTDFVAETGGTNLALDTWSHVGLVHDATADTVAVYFNGASDCAGGCATQQDMTASALDLRFAAGPAGANSNEWTGRLDECGVYAGVIGPESMCRICSCGIDGSACTISGTSFTDTGRNTASCGSCTLPTDASQAAPGVN